MLTKQDCRKGIILSMIAILSFSGCEKLGKESPTGLSTGTESQVLEKDPLTVPLASQPEIIGYTTNPANGHIYFLLERSSWTAAQTKAVELGGNLATINDAAEDSWVYSTFSTFGDVNRNLWIGLNDAQTEGTFVWVSGEPVTYSNFFPGEPNNFLGVEDYVQIFGPSFSNSGQASHWNDITDDPPFPGEGLASNGVVEVSATVTICHKPGTPAQQTLVIPIQALAGHLRHGDTIGPCN